MLTVIFSHTDDQKAAGIFQKKNQGKERKHLLRQWCIFSPGEGNQTQEMLSLVH